MNLLQNISVTFKLLLKRSWSTSLKNQFNFKSGDLVIYIDNEWNYGILKQGHVYSVNCIGYTGFFVSEVGNEKLQFFASEDCFIPYIKALTYLLRED